MSGSLERPVAAFPVSERLRFCIRLSEGLEIRRLPDSFIFYLLLHIPKLVFLPVLCTNLILIMEI